MSAATLVLSGWCVDAAQATDLGHERSAARLHASCRFGSCGCSCHRRDEE